MTIIQYFSLYFLLGIIWSGWIEYFTTKHKIGGPWNNFERLYQLVMWPTAFITFIITWINEVFKNE